MNNGWPTVPLCEVATPVQRTVAVVPGKSYRTLGVKWWGEGAYERETIDGSQTAATTLNEVREGDLIINKIWVRHGSVAIVGREVHGCAGSNEFPTFDLNRQRVLPRWLHWYTKTRDLWQKCDALSQGTSGKNRIRPERFLSIQIPLPSLPEQQRSVAKIEELATKIDHAKKLKTDSIEQSHFTVPAETSRIFAGLAACPRKQLGKLGTDGSNPIQTGPFGAQLHKSEFVPEGIPVLNVGNVDPDGLILSPLDYVLPEKAAQLSRYSLQPDDLLFARSGATLGKVCLVPRACDGWLMTGHLFRVRLDDAVCVPSFAFVALRGARLVRDQIFAQVRGATRPGFNTTLLSNVCLPIPPIREQRCIVAHLDDLQAKVDALKAQQAQSSAELDALLPSVLDKAFNGEL